MNQLLELRYAIEKLQPLDGKLKYQIDRLLKQASPSAEHAEEDTITTSSARPNLHALLDDDDEDEDGGNAVETDLKKGVYRAPRIAAVPYADDRAKEKRQDKLEKQKKKLRNSEMFDALREEFGSTPELSSSTGMSAVNASQKVLEQEEEERRNFEEDRFVRLVRRYLCN
jgi:hypothetical protein